MTATATLRIPYPDPATAGRIAATLAPDDDDYVTTRVEGPDLVVDARAPDLPGLLRALDDVLATLGVAEDVPQNPHPKT